MQQQLGKYTLGALIGQGGMGAVYESFHPQLGRPVAIKVMSDALAADPQARRRFLREAQTAALLSHHGIVNILDVDEDGGRPFIVMEKLDEGSLAARLARGALSLGEALRLARSLAETLDYAHRQGVIHRDLKPANVLLRPDGSPVLADFGLARPALPDPAERITSAGVLLGTLAYMAPEQITAGHADERSDIYALGVLLYELLAGRLPFDGDSGQVIDGHLRREPPPIRANNPAVTTDAERLTLRMLAKDPGARPQTAAEVTRDLGAMLERDAATGPTVAIDRSSTPKLAPNAIAYRARPVNRPLVWALLGLAACAVLLALALSGGMRRSSGALIAPTTSLQGGATQPPERATAPQAASGAPALTPVALQQVSQPQIVDAQPAGAGPEQFSVGGLTYRADTDTIWFFGEVRNDRGEARESVEVRLLLLDDAGNELLSKTGFAERSFLEAGEVSPFSVLFTDDDGPLPKWSRYRAEVRSRAADLELRTTVRDVQVDDDLRVGRRAYSASVVVSGLVRNRAALDAQYTEVIAVFYDVEGRVVGVGSSYVEDGEENRIAPGQAARFSLDYVSFSGEPAAYYIFAEARSFE